MYNRLKILRAERNWSQAELALRLNVSRQAVNALVAVIVVSPWLIAGAARLNAALESSLTWTMGLPGAWILGVLAFVVVVAMRVRGR